MNHLKSKHWLRYFYLRTRFDVTADQFWIFKKFIIKFLCDLCAYIAVKYEIIYYKHKLF